MDKIYAIIPRRSFFYLLLCLTGVLIIIIGGIVPNHFSLSRLDEQIKNIQFQNEEQKRLYPIYEIMQKRTRVKESGILPSPARVPLLRTQIDAIPATFRDIAKKAHVDMVSAFPDLNYLNGESRFLLINVIIRGDFFDFRKFLIGLGELPFLQRIEEIQIQQHEDIMEFKMKVWLAIA